MDFKTIRFVVIASLLYGLFHFSYHQVPNEVLSKTVYPTIIGHPAALAINIITPDKYVKVLDHSLISSKAKLKIVRGCDGSGVLFMLVAAVLGFGASFRQTLVGLALGITTVYVINQIRIVGLFYVVDFNRLWFPPVHTYYAPTLIVFLIAGFFLLWTRWTILDSAKRSQTAHPEAAELKESPVSSGGKISLNVLKALVIWFVLSQAGDKWGEAVVKPLFPLYQAVAEQASDFDQFQLDIIEKKSTPHIQLSASSSTALPITPQSSLRPGHVLQSSISVLHALVPLVIFLTIVLAWPANSWRQRVTLYLTAIPLLLIISALTAPLQLIGNMEIGFQNAAGSMGYARPEPLVLTWMLITEGGARWLIPALLGLGAALLISKLSRAKDKERGN